MTLTAEASCSLWIFTLPFLLKLWCHKRPWRQRMLFCRLEIFLHWCCLMPKWSFWSWTGVRKAHRVIFQVSSEAEEMSDKATWYTGHLVGDKAKRFCPWENDADVFAHFVQWVPTKMENEDFLMEVSSQFRVENPLRYHYLWMVNTQSSLNSKEAQERRIGEPVNLRLNWRELYLDEGANRRSGNHFYIPRSSDWRHLP